MVGGNQLGVSDDEPITAQCALNRRSSWPGWTRWCLGSSCLIGLTLLFQRMRQGGYLPCRMAILPRIHLMKQWYALGETSRDNALFEVPAYVCLQESN